MLTAEEEADVLRLFPAAAAPAPTPAPLGDHPPPVLFAIRERLVLDAACGSDSWSVEVVRRDLDFCSQEEDGAWSACVSVVVRLHAFGRASHDETGTGRAKQAELDAQTVEAIAFHRAVDGGVRRLAKMFAVSLGQQVLHCTTLHCTSLCYTVLGSCICLLYVASRTR